MGLDLVELMMRTEEVFSLDLPPEDCEQVQTVGDLYQVVLGKLSLPYEPSSDLLPLSTGMAFLLHPPDQWTPPQVWIAVKAVVHEQLRVGEDEIRESASFQNDLRAD